MSVARTSGLRCCGRVGLRQGAEEPWEEHHTPRGTLCGGGDETGNGREGCNHHHRVRGVRGALSCNTKALKEGQVVVLDNLNAHKGERVRRLVEARGSCLLFLPSYSPDFSPIEKAFSKLKALSCGGSEHARRGCSSGRAGEHWTRQRPKMQGAGLTTAAMRLPIKRHENRCRYIVPLAIPNCWMLSQKQTHQSVAHVYVVYAQYSATYHPHGP